MAYKGLKIGLALAEMAAIGGLGYQIHRNLTSPSFPDALKESEAVQQLVDLHRDAVSKCEKGGENPYQALEDWLPTRQATIEGLGLRDESYHFCDGPAKDRRDPKLYGAVVVSEGFPAPKWTLVEASPVQAVFETGPDWMERSRRTIALDTMVSNDPLFTGHSESR